MKATEIDPQAREAVALQERLPMPHSTGGLKLLRLLTRATMWVRNRNPPRIGETIDRTIPGPGGDLDTRLYLPSDDSPVPTVVFFHGGGFVLGSIDTHDWFCRHLTRESGCGVLSVDYRLAPEHPFPAAVEDAYAALEWAAEHTDAVSGTGQLAVAGDSAGGALAAIAALIATEQGGPALDYQALIYPSVGVEPDQQSVRNHAGTVLSESDLEWFQECYYGSDIHNRNPYADPIQACDLSGVPPATVLTAGFDPLRDGGKRYAERLVQDGVTTRYKNYDTMIHGFVTLRTVDRAHDAISKIADDLTNAFGTH